MTKSFFTTSQAKAANYTPARLVRSMNIRHNGARLVARDVSGWPCFGYAYQLAVEIPEWMTESGSAETLNPAGMPAAEEVWFSEEKNKAGTLGCFSLMLSAAAIEEGQRIMERAMDDWLESNPEAREALAAHEAAAAARDARRAQRLARRHPGQA